MVKRGLILGGILATISLASFSYVYADTTGSTKFSVDVENTVLELTIPATPAVIDLNPTMTGASFGSTNVTVKVATNNITGYQLTMTPTNSQTNTSLIRTELVGSESTYREIETLNLTDPVSTGYPEADFTANRWGYKITGDNYYGIDPNNTTVSHPAWITNEPTNGTNHNLTLAAKVDASTVSGAYETTLNFRAVTNAVVAKDTIKFNANGGTGTMSDIVVVAGESSVLPANAFTPPSGMRFVGWSTVASGTGGLVYADQATYTPISTDYSKTVNLYAQWVPSNSPTPSGSSVATGTTFTRAYEIAYTAMKKGMYEEQHEGQGDYALVDSWNPTNPESYKNYDVRFAMQDMTPEICASVTVMHDDYEALDIRDNKLYHITKLLDGKCWMTENLDYNLPAGTITSDTTDLTQFNTLLYDTSHGYSINTTTGVISWTPSCATLGQATINTTTGKADGWDYCNRSVGWGIDFAPSSLDLGDWYVNTTTNNCPFWEENTVCDNIKHTPFVDSNGTHGTIGNLYNYAASIASNNTTMFVLESNDSIEFPHDSNSICPRGWRLPSVTTISDATDPRNEAAYVNGLYGGTGHTNLFPQYLVGSGRINDSGIVNVGSAYYNTSTPAGPESNAGKYYNFVYSFSDDIDSWGKGIGNTIRCVAR